LTLIHPPKHLPRKKFTLGTISNPKFLLLRLPFGHLAPIQPPPWPSP
jgi:hypothetical protein